MTGKEQQSKQQEEVRDLDVPAGAAQEVKGGKVSVQDVSDRRGAAKPFLAANHNETLVRGGRLINHSETLVREGLKSQHNETLVRRAISVNHNETVVLRDLDLPEAEAKGVKGGARGDIGHINGESQDNSHAAEIEVMSWSWGLK